MITYDRRALAKAYADVHPDAKDGYYYNAAFNTALREHRQEVLDGLQRLFGVALDDLGGWPAEVRALYLLFRGTIKSYVAVDGPLSGAGEAGLLYKQLAGTDRQQHVLASLDRITACAVRSREAHLDVLESLIEVVLGDRRDMTVTSADLKAIGVDDTAGPRSADYDLWEDY
ncbi:hypothetical protein [Saccharothrix longispora]|uniref:hypothetical protein n=1 Tax=Saccharothrix longispora TaxID=33920 RepID=UPI0028FD951B|nr:hypothetical protein [Saccharothrix longispora]MDU0291576.1 hypothetical protein [Saccharothrix longispora]